MGEPIRLWRGDDEVIVYGQHEANALVEHGWMVGPKPTEPKHVTMKEVLANATRLQPADDAAPEGEPQPASDAAPEPPAKPTRKRAGEYGSGAGTQRTVDKEQIAAVKAERTEDAANE